MTHFATVGDERSPAETELASVLAADAVLIDGFAALVLLVRSTGHCTAILIVAVLGFVVDEPMTP